MDTHIVITDNGDSEPELAGFQSRSLAEEYAEVRGSSEVQTVTAMNDNEASLLIARERRGI